MRQLADYQEHLAELAEVQTSVVALSTDPEDKATESVENQKVTFPVLYGLEIPRDGDTIGAYYETERGIFHATNFILSPSRKVAHATYSTGPVGRIVAADAMGVIKFMQKMAAEKK